VNFDNKFPDATVTIRFGAYRAFYATKAMDMRTLSDRRKLIRWFATEHKKESSGTLKLLFSDNVTVPDFFLTAQQGKINLSTSGAGRFGCNVSRDRHIIQFGNIDAVGFQIYTWSLPEYEQLGVV
jgi:hypothetical protein